MLQRIRWQFARYEEILGPSRQLLDAVLHAQGGGAIGHGVAEDEPQRTAASQVTRRTLAARCMLAQTAIEGARNARIQRIVGAPDDVDRPHGKAPAFREVYVLGGPISSRNDFSLGKDTNRIMIRFRQRGESGGRQ
jgi:hypothetical protein